MTMEFTCKFCRKPYKLKDELAGKRARCKECGTTFTIPTPPAADEYRIADFDDAFGDAARPASSPESAGSPCPSCRSPMAPGAMLCVNCGFNLQTGQKLQTSHAAIEAEPTKVGVAASFMRGTLCFESVGR